MCVLDKFMSEGIDYYFLQHCSYNSYSYKVTHSIILMHLS